MEAAGVDGGDLGDERRGAGVGGDGAAGVGAGIGAIVWIDRSAIFQVLRRTA